MHDLIPGHRYDEREIRGALGGAAPDGPFIVGRGGTALIAPAGAKLELLDRARLRWPGRAPERVVERGIELLVFVERSDATIQFLGTARVASYGVRQQHPADVTFELQPALARALWLELVSITSPLPPVEPFPEAPLVALGTTSTPTDRWAALRAFVEQWYGQPIAASPGGRPSATGPALVHDLLAVWDAVPDLFRFNQAVPADELAVEDGKLTFLVENQGVCLWATEAEGDDPRVWSRNNDEGEPWLEEPVRLSTFLIQAVLFEAILHARYGGSLIAAPTETLRAVIERVDALSDEPWQWCGAAFHARDGALVMTTEHEGSSDIWLAARTPLALARFADLVTDDWERVAF